MLINIKQFALTGDFGPIKIGENKNSVLNILGKPDDEADLGSSGSEIIFAWYELFLDSNEELFAIQIDNYVSEDPETYNFENDKFKIEPWLMTSPKAPSYNDVIVLLKSEGVSFDEFEYYERSCIKLESDVVIDFHEEPKAVGLRPLLGFRYWPTFN